jgi:hypothetical protein
MPRSIAPASRESTGRTSTRSDAAAAWIAPKFPLPPGEMGSRMTAARVKRGAISLSSSRNFPLWLYSIEAKPVVLPPGRAKLSTRPAPTGSFALGNTIGTVRLTCCNSLTVPPVPATIASGASATNSAAFLRMLSRKSAPPQRVSIRRLRPSVQPNSRRPWRSATISDCPTGFSGDAISTPMRRIRSGCCARAASGQMAAEAAAAPPRPAINSRRLMASPNARPRRRHAAGEHHRVGWALRPRVHRAGTRCAGAMPTPSSFRSLAALAYRTPFGPRGGRVVTPALRP